MEERRRGDGRSSEHLLLLPFRLLLLGGCSIGGDCLNRHARACFAPMRRFHRRNTILSSKADRQDILLNGPIEWSYDYMVRPPASIHPDCLTDGTIECVLQSIARFCPQKSSESQEARRKHPCSPQEREARVLMTNMPEVQGTWSLRTQRAPCDVDRPSSSPSNTSPRAPSILTTRCKCCTASADLTVFIVTLNTLPERAILPLHQASLEPYFRGNVANGIRIRLKATKLRGNSTKH